MGVGTGAEFLLAATLAALPGQAADFSLPLPGDFLRSAVQTPAPAPERAGPSPYILAELRMEPFKGRTPLETQAKAERFIAALGLPLIQYQDNEVFRFMDVAPEPAGQTLLGRAQRFLLARDARAALAAQPLVKEVSSDGDGILTARFSRPLYSEEMSAIRARLPAGLVTSTRRMAEMKGLWVHLGVPAGRDPQDAAAALAAAHPDEFAECRATADRLALREPAGYR